MRSRYFIIGALAIIAVLSIVVLPPFRYGDSHNRTDTSILRAQSLVAVCIYYRNKPDANNKYPSQIDELIPMIEDGNAGILDAWGQRFRYAIVLNEQGEPEPYVWSEHISDGRTYLCGAKGMSNGNVVVFGMRD